MESVLLFIIIGFVIFLIGQLLKISFQSYKFFIYTITGFIVGAILGKISQPYFPYPLSLTWTISAFSGWMTGILLYWAEKLNLFSKTGIEYIATLLLGGIEAIILWGIFKARILFYSEMELIQQIPDMQLLLICIIVGFVSIFGYALPYRWFIKKSA